MQWLVVKFMNGNIDAAEYNREKVFLLAACSDIKKIDVVTAECSEVARAIAIAKFGQKQSVSSFPQFSTGRLHQIILQEMSTTIKKHGGRQDMAARELGITPRVLCYWKKRYQL